MLERQRPLNGTDEKDKINDGFIDESQNITEDIKDEEEEIL